MELVGRYRIIDRIGEGAMADVYRAHDPDIGRDIAVKVLKGELRQNREVKTRFLQEARAAGALSHAGIVTIHDVGEADGFPYIAMELLEGEPLDARLREDGRLALDAVLRIGEQLAEALHYAHQLGVVHRDIKPSNIMLCDNGRSAKILDFGIARVREADRVRVELAMLRTQAGQVLGTPRYMSPEQALGLETDRRSDLFSLGAVLFEMMAGRPAFDGASVATIALQITRDRVPFSSVGGPDCPAGLRFIIGKLLAKDPSRRFASGAVLAEALRHERRACAAEAAGRHWFHSFEIRRTAAMGAVTAGILALSIGFVLHRQYAEMERMALTSGHSVANFIANNVALRAVENAALPETQQDWVPVQAFVESAAEDPNLREILVSDTHGVIRGASTGSRVGTRHSGAIAASGHSGIRVGRDILYAGRRFGRVEIVLSKAGLDAAAAASRDLLLGLGLAVLLFVMAMAYASSRVVARQIRRLNRSLERAAAGETFRVSHSRSDELGELFDRFNALMANIDERGDALPPHEDPAFLEATRIERLASVPAVGRRKRA